jgi:uncharacterized protein
MIVYIDADACPVKAETFKVAERHKLKVIAVANSYINTPQSFDIEMVVVKGDFDAADDWIVEKVDRNDIVITNDILLAERCIKKQARVIGAKGNEFTEDNIGSAVASRELMQNLRHMGENRGGPTSMDKKDRSRYLAKLDEVIHAAKRNT